jgi:hypothetical protein
VVLLCLVVGLELPVWHVGSWWTEAHGGQRGIESTIGRDAGQQPSLAGD